MDKMTPEKLHEWADHPITNALSAAEIHAAADAWEADRARIKKLEKEIKRLKRRPRDAEI